MNQIKTFIILVLLSCQFCAPLVLQAQFESSYNPVYSAQHEVLVNAGQGKWLAGGNSNDIINWAGQAYLIMYDSLGNRLWEYKPSSGTGDMGWIREILPDGNGGFLILGEMKACDVGYGGGFVEKIDSNGNQVWSHFYNSDGLLVGNGFEFGSSVIGESGNIYASFGPYQRVLKMNSMGDSLEIWNPTFGGIRGMASYGPDKLVMIGGGNLVMMDTTGNELIKNLISQSASNISLETGPNKEVFVTSNGYLYSFDSTLSVIDSVFLGTFGISVGNLHYANGSLYLVHVTSLVLEFDLNLQLVKQHSFSGHSGFTPSMYGNSISTNRLALAGQFAEGVLQSGFALRTFDLASGNTASPGVDAGIINGRMDTAYAVEVFPGIGLFDLYFDTWVTVMNYGTDTLQEVTVNAYLITQVMCGHAGAHEVFTNLSLAPGDSIELFMGNLMDFALPLSTVQNYCFEPFTSSPNQLFDNDVTNNKRTVCLDSVLISVTPDTDPGWTIYPNPLIDQVTIELGEVKDGVEATIFDVSGRLVFHERIVQTYSQFDLSELPAGIYVLQLLGNGNRVTRKLLKQ